MAVKRYKNNEPRENIAEASTGTSTFPGVVDEKDNAPAKTIGEDEIKVASKVLESYRAGKSALDERIIDNNQWYKLRHWAKIRSKRSGADKEPEPASAWLFSALNNKHADAMDNIPELNVLPRESGDVEEAKRLSAIMPVIYEQCHYGQVYSDMWWQKLKGGTGVLGAFWNPSRNNGLGDIDIRTIDILNLFWEPGVKDIQDSAHMFSIQLVNNEALEAIYPELRGKLGGNDQQVKEYVHDDTIDTSKKSAVIDWYYKKTLSSKKQVLHYCKYVGEHVLYASENEPEYQERGFYDHGLYPFIFDVMFVEEDSPAGFGYLDLCKDAQKQIDRMNQAILKNALMSTKPRWFVKGDGSVSEEEYANWDNSFVHYHGNGDPNESIMQIRIDPMQEMHLGFLNAKIDEMKEVSGNRDFSQGGTASGVTAASAIAALQEAGNKLSRDMISSSYRAYEELGSLVIELIRQFYTQPRCFRITGEDGLEFTSYDNANIRAQHQMQDGTELDLGIRLPVFDIKVKSQKRSPFSTAVENERAKELYALGFYAAENAESAIACLDMMTFEGKEKIVERLQERVDLHAQMEMMQSRIDELTRIIDAQNGTTLNQAAAAEMAVPAPTQTSPSGAQTAARTIEPNQLGSAVINRHASPDGAARVQAAAAASPRI